MLTANYGTERCAGVGLRHVVDHAYGQRAHDNDRVDPMPRPSKIITAEKMDEMTPQERADVVDRSIVRSWDDVEDSFKIRVQARAELLAAELRSRA